VHDVALLNAITHSSSFTLSASITPSVAGITHSTHKAFTIE